VAATFESAKQFASDVRGEVRKLVSPTREEIKATTTVVIATVFLFGLFFFLVDNIIGRGIQYVLHHLGGTQ
jgi:preprotein translocase subunit SecE